MEIKGWYSGYNIIENDTHKIKKKVIKMVNYTHRIKWNQARSGIHNHFTNTPKYRDKISRLKKTNEKRQTIILSIERQSVLCYRLKTDLIHTKQQEPSRKNTTKWIWTWIWRECRLITKSTSSLHSVISFHSHFHFHFACDCALILNSFSFPPNVGAANIRSFFMDRDLLRKLIFIVTIDWI